MPIRLKATIRVEFLEDAAMNEPNLQDLNRQIGQSIARRRQQAGLTQEETAEKLGIGYEAVSRMERGLVMPTVVRLYQLAEIFGCTSADLLDESSPLAGDQARQFDKWLAPLSDADRKLVAQIVQSLCARLQS